MGCTAAEHLPSALSWLSLISEILFQTHLRFVVLVISTQRVVQRTGRVYCRIEELILRGRWWPQGHRRAENSGER